MSLYRHVASKEELLAHLVDAAYEGAPAPPQPAEGWRASLARWARDHMAVLRHHVWLSSVPSAGPPLMPNQVLWFERGLGCLQRSGLPEVEKPAVLLLVSGFVRNEAALAAQALAPGQTGEAPGEPPRGSYGQLLAQLADPVRFPALHAALAAGGFEFTDADAAFEFGLTRVLDGVDALVRARRAGR
jgi:AcrR family transcriptional regulator